MEQDVTYKNSTIVDWLEELIIKDIRDKELKFGDEIPTEAELAKKYDVGRNAVREALSRLRMLGVIESRQRRGIIVSRPDITFNFNKVINPNVLSKETILELLGMRVFLEVGSASMVVNNVTDDDIAQLKKIVAKEEEMDSIKLNIEMEKEFHSKIYAISQNKTMLDFLNVIIPVFKYVNDNYADFSAFDTAALEGGRIIRHRDFIPYLEQRDGEGYRKAVEDHLRAYTNYIKHHLK